MVANEKVRRNKHVRSYGVCESTANRIFHDPFYYGLLIQAGHAVGLKQLYPDFKPVVTAEEFNIVQAQAKDRIKQQIVARQLEMVKLDDELTEINEKIVDPSKLKLTAENFLDPLNSLDLQMRAADMLQIGPFGPKNILEPRKNEEMSKNKMLAFYFSRRRSFVYN